MAEFLISTLFPTHALELPEPAASYREQGDDLALARELAENYDAYHKAFAQAATSALKVLQDVAPTPEISTQWRRPPVADAVAVSPTSLIERHQAFVEAGSILQAATNAEALARSATAEGFSLDKLQEGGLMLVDGAGGLLHRDVAPPAPSSPPENPVLLTLDVRTQ